ncbi:hypothetical protein GCM10009869_25250 [Amnibacterium kyonggiense]
MRRRPRLLPGLPFTQQQRRPWTEWPVTAERRAHWSAHHVPEFPGARAARRVRRDPLIRDGALRDRTGVPERPSCREAPASGCGPRGGAESSPPQRVIPALSRASPW